MAVVDLYLAIDGAGSKSVAIAVESCGLYHVFVAMLEEDKRFLVGLGGRIFHHGRHSRDGRDG